MLANPVQLWPNAGKVGGLKLLCCASALPLAVRRGVLPDGAEPVTHGYTVPKAAEYMPFMRQLTVFCAPDVAVPDGPEHTLRPQNLLRDRDYGAWAGAGLQALDPALQHAFLTDTTFAPPEGESFAAAYHRAALWLDGISQHLPAAVVLARPAVVRNLLLKVLYQEENVVGLAHAARLDVPPLSYSLISYHAGKWRLGMLGAPA
ncbi:histidine phosphatase family protein [Acetobacter fabarum]|uniref:histidine phosphatase family protein n=1 Tax=Acetobacter fabarum TaxID=483199 RepID=UPI00312B5130